ncbi:NAD(P)/FAD-dependent oxidoreductase [Bdellovibrio sp. HCB337]|uniref:NAD(P)/FAD-dependent oxidoreductase n=1 Tax=Bdellovibrio sp. HCB337 TaxID=3394358 RepID=UPI0039A62AE4
MRLVHPEKHKGKKIVIVVGGGFAGLNTAQTLAKQKDVHVLLIDQRNHHLFQPLLYQVATAGLNPADIAVPIRAQFPDVANIEVHLGRLSGVNLKEQYIVGMTLDGEREIAYDYLVLACGAQHSYFAHPEWEGFAPGLKTLEQATEIRRRILLAFETAENEFDPKLQESLMTFVIVGAGPTGVELAGAISDISRTVLIKDFRRIDPSKAKVILVEAGPRILASFPEDLSARAHRDLLDLGVEVRTNARVENINAEGAKVGDEFLNAKSVFWAAGVQASAMNLDPAVEKDRAGRVIVNDDFSIPNFKNAFVIGDMAAFEMAPGKLLPGLAPAAMQAGRHAGNMILADIRGKNRKAFQYLDKGQMATIGKNRAIAQSGKLKMTGHIAWLAWLFIHVFYLIDFKNRVSVMSQWVWSYMFSKRGARLITEKEWQLKK